MRLFVRDKRNPKNKIYLKLLVPTRMELFNKLQRNHFIINEIRYNISEVVAESGTNSTRTGAVLGGVIGILGGPWGVAAGATAGGILGKQGDLKDQEKVDKFNNSRVYG